MLRISKVIDQNPSGVTLKLEGRLATEWVELFEGECLQCLKVKRKVRLDFSDVTFVDDNGLKMLRSIAAKDVAG